MGDLRQEEYQGLADVVGISYFVLNWLGTREGSEQETDTPDLDIQKESTGCHERDDPQIGKSGCSRLGAMRVMDGPVLA